MSAALPLSPSAARTADGLGSEGQPALHRDPTGAPGQPLAGIGHPITTRHRIDLRALQDQWQAEADRARFNMLRTAIRATGPDGLPLWLGALLIPAALALAAFAAAMARGGL